jgi:hypothetical protein
VCVCVCVMRARTSSLRHSHKGKQCRSSVDARRGGRRAAVVGPRRQRRQRRAASPHILALQSISQHFLSLSLSLDHHITTTIGTTTRHQCRCTSTWLVRCSFSPTAARRTTTTQQQQRQRQRQHIATMVGCRRLCTIVRRCVVGDRYDCAVSVGVDARARQWQADIYAAARRRRAARHDRYLKLSIQQDNYTINKSAVFIYEYIVCVFFFFFEHYNLCNNKPPC